MPLGLFKGVRQFNLTRSGDQTEFYMREDFSGLLSGVIWNSMPNLQPSFDKFADTVKRLTEAGTS